MRRRTKYHHHRFWSKLLLRIDNQFCEGEGHQVPQDRVSDRPREVDGSTIHLGRSCQEAPWLCPQGICIFICVCTWICKRLPDYVLKVFVFVFALVFVRGWLCPQGNTLIWYRHRWWWWKSLCLSIICRCIFLIFFFFRSLATTPSTGNFKWTTIDKWDIVLTQQIKARVVTTHYSKTNKNKYQNDNLCTVQAHILPKKRNTKKLHKQWQPARCIFFQDKHK